MSGLVVTAYGVPRSYPDPLLSVGWHKVGLVKIYPLRTDWWLPETKGGRWAKWMKGMGKYKFQL